MENLLNATFYSSPDIWRAIISIRASPENIFVASPYISGKVHFDWEYGDSLLIALSKENVQKGFVNPFAVEEIMDKGVKVYSNEKLHAKIYSNRKQAIICSCNLSYASQNNWLEAGVFVTDTFNLESVKGFFEENLKDASLVTKESLIYLKSIFKTDTDEIKKQKNELEFVGNVWSVPLIEGEKLNENSIKAIQNSRNKIETNKDTFTYYFFTTNNNNVYKVGDYIIQFKNVSDRMQIFFPAKCIEIKPIAEKHFSVHLAHRSSYKPLEWDKLKPFFADLDLKAEHQIINQKQKVLERLYYHFNQ